MRNHNKVNKIGLIVSLVMALAMIMVIPAFAIQYQVINLGSLGNDNSYAYGINDSSEVVGYYNTKVSDLLYNHAFIWKNGSMQKLPERSLAGGVAYDINNDGTVVGVATFLLKSHGVPYGADRAVVWPRDGQEMVNLNAFLPKRSALESLQRAEAINNHGEIVGDAGAGAFIAVPR